MIRKLKKRKTERLCVWLDRISDYYSEHDIDTKTFRELITEISKESYIQGSHDGRQIYAGVIARRMK